MGLVAMVVNRGGLVATGAPTADMSAAETSAAE